MLMTSTHPRLHHLHHLPKPAALTAHRTFYYLHNCCIVFVICNSNL